MRLLGPNSIKDGLVILEILVDIVLEKLLEALLEILVEIEPEIVEFAVIVGKILFVAEKVEVCDFVGIEYHRNETQGEHHTMQVKDKKMYYH